MSYPSLAGGGAYGTRRLSTEALHGVLLWLMGFASGFVFIEPGPYELVAPLAIFLFAVTGFSLRPQVAPLVLLLILLDIGYAVAVVPVADDGKAVTWVYISAFMAATAVFYAGALGHDIEFRARRLLQGYIAAALVASLVAIAAYFNLLGSLSDLFLLYGRARGTFNDPNVLGAFLVLPAVVLFQRGLNGRPAELVGSAVQLMILLVGLFLTFSRGAWGQLALSGLVLMAVGFATTRSQSRRVRILLVALFGAVAILLLVVALVSIPQVADIFSERVTLDQSYDLGHFGRFGRYILGAELGLDRPFGIGPLQFWRYFGEDPHNSFLNAFMSGGWLSGFALLAITAVTLINATRFLRVETPWQATYHVFYAAYVGVVAESAIIDADHWRHYFLILGALWGMMAASRAYLGGERAVSRSPG